MNPRLKRVLKWIAYCSAYLFALLIFAYFTFPYDRLKERIVGEFNARQTGPEPQHLELDKLDSYWFSGIEADGVRLVSQPPPPTDASKKAEKPKVLAIDSAHARLSLLNLLIGKKVTDFGAEAFGGQISGRLEDSESERNIELEVEGVDLSEAPLVSDAIGLPAFGKLSGIINLQAPEARLSKAEGKIDLKIVELAVGDGKAKIRDTIALPRIDAGELVLQAEANGGTVKITQFSATGPDIEFQAEGTIRLRDQPESSNLSLTVKFKFTERYTQKNEMTRGLFGSGSTPGLFDLDPKNRRAKHADGFYGWRVSGTLARPSFTPQGGDAAGSGTKHKSAR